MLFRSEKISPREVDEILMDHPAVAQMVCFGMPHPKLGEEVAAVVVLREGQQFSERELQAFVAARAADYKVPKMILFMTKFPKAQPENCNASGWHRSSGSSNFNTDRVKQ